MCTYVRSLDLLILMFAVLFPPPLVQGPTLVTPPFTWYMERGPPPLPNAGMTMKPSPMATNQIVADAQSFVMQKQHSDAVESSKPKKKKRKIPSENGDTLAPVGTGGKGCSRRPARIRTSFTNEQIQELEAHFLRCMYPRSTEIQRISSQLQLTENIVQVCPWLGVCFTTYVRTAHVPSVACMLH